MLRATRNLASGLVFASARLASSLLPFADSAPFLVVKNGAPQQRLLGQVEQIALVGQQAGLEQGLADW